MSRAVRLLWRELGYAAIAVLAIALGVDGVSPFDPTSFLAAPLVLTVAAVLASVAPARRAARIDPIRVLRAE